MRSVVRLRQRLLAVGAAVVAHPHRGAASRYPAVAFVGTAMLSGAADLGFRS